MNPATDDATPRWPAPDAPQANTRISAPRRVLSGNTRHGVPLHDAAHSAQLEHLHAQLCPPHTLMRRAGQALARLALALAPHCEQIVVVAGPGNNGGDGFEAARLLHLAGKRVRVWWSGTTDRQPVDACDARCRALASGVDVQSLLLLNEASTTTRTTSAGPSLAADLVRALLDAGARTLVIDALLGRGLNGPARGPLAACIAAINASAAQVLAVDLPSGLNGDTGSWAPAPGAPATAAIEADWTLALLTPAPGLFTGGGRDAAGEVWWHDLAVDPHAVEPQALLECGATFLNLLQPRRHITHKGSFGDVWVVGGGPSMAGAAWLAARAALQCGAGRVYVDLLDLAARQIDPGQPELMLGESADEPRRLAGATVIAGCGGGAAVIPRLPLLIGHAGRLVLDADALNAIASHPALDQALRERGVSGKPTVLTPHPLEAARLLGGSVAEVQNDRMHAARTLAERWQAVVVLKGSGTVVATPSHKPSINASGNAALASPGSGDVLAGCLGGLWSRHAGQDFGQATESPGALALARDAALAACHFHGHTAQSLSPNAEALPAGRLAQGMGDALRQLAATRNA